MNEHDAILAAVVADPDDDTPRLIYADFVEGQGDATRAEFIRLQIESVFLEECKSLSEEITDAQDNVLSPRSQLMAHEKYFLRIRTCGQCHWCLLKQRERELLSLQYHPFRYPHHHWSRNTIVWRKPSSPHADLVPAFTVTFRRGFIEAIECTCQQFSDHQSGILQLRPTIREIRLTDFTHNHDFGSLPILPSSGKWRLAPGIHDGATLTRLPAGVLIK